jgi:hypothetical protein
LEKSEGRSDIYPMVPVVQFSVALGDRRVGLEMSLKEEVWDIRLGERYRTAPPPCFLHHSDANITLSHLTASR